MCVCLCLCVGVTVPFIYLFHMWLLRSWVNTSIQKSWSRQYRCLHSDMDLTDIHQYLTKKWKQGSKGSCECTGKQTHISDCDCTDTEVFGFWIFVTKSLLKNKHLYSPKHFKDWSPKDVQYLWVNEEVSHSNTWTFSLFHILANAH